MFKTLQKSLLVAALFTGAMNVNAQVISGLVEEHFDNQSQWPLAGYSRKDACEPIAAQGTTPAVVVNYKAAPYDTVISKTYNDVPVTYALHNSAIDPLCTPKGTGSPLSNGYIDLNKGVDATITITIGAIVKTIELGISATGSTGRFVLAGKSIDGGITWDTILNYRTTSQTPAAVTAGTNLVSAGRSYGSIQVNATNPMIRIWGNANYLRLHDFYVDGNPLGLDKGSLFDNGAKVLVSDNNVTVTSPKSGTVQLVNADGNTVDQKEMRNEVSFTNLRSGLYIVKLMADNQVSVRKVMIQ